MSGIEIRGDRLPTILRLECYPDGRLHCEIETWCDRRNPDQGLVNARAILWLVKTATSECTPEEGATIEGILRGAEARALARATPQPPAAAPAPGEAEQQPNP